MRLARLLVFCLPGPARVSPRQSAIILAFSQLTVIALPGLLTEPDSARAESAPETDPPPSGLRELWVISHDAMNPAERLLAGTLQGLVGRKQPRIWLRSGSMN